MPINTAIIDNASGTYPTMTPSGDTWSDWLNYATGALQYLSGALAATGAGGRRGAYDSSKPGLGDSEVGGTLTALPGNDTERVDWGLRLVNPNNNSLQSGYIFRWALNQAGADTCTLVRIDSNVVGATLFSVSMTTDYAVGDKFRAEAIGNVLSLYRIASGTGAETQIGTATDSTYSTGYMGLAMDFGTVRVDDVFGGPLGSFMVPPKAPMLMRLSL